MVPTWINSQWTDTGPSDIELLFDRLDELSLANAPIFDPSDITSLFQDAAGTTPVTSHTDPIGSVLDKRHMGTLTAAQYIAGLDDDKADGVTALEGTATAATYNTLTGEGTVSRATGMSNSSYVHFSSLSAAASYRLDIQNTGAASITIRSGLHNGTAVQVVATGERMTIFAAPGSGNVSITPTTNDTTASFTLHSFKEVPGYRGVQATGSRRPLYDTSLGFAAIKWDGLDDCLQTPFIDYTGGDEIMAVCGYRKIGDTTGRPLVEFGPVWSGIQGGFILAASWNTDVGNAGFGLRGNANSSNPTPNGSAPVNTNLVLTGYGKISTDTNIARLNGTQVSSSSDNAGTGNLGNRQLNIGARDNGASVPFSGYSTWLMIAPTNDAQLLALAETVAAPKTGVTL